MAKRHLFKATRIGWGSKIDGVWFDADTYTKEEAIAQFKPYHDHTWEGYPYTGYYYDGQKYHDFTYLGVFEEDEMPTNDEEYYAYLRKNHKI